VRKNTAVITGRYGSHPRSKPREQSGCGCCVQRHPYIYLLSHTNYHRCLFIEGMDNFVVVNLGQYFGSPPFSLSLPLWRSGRAPPLLKNLENLSSGIYLE